MIPIHNAFAMLLAAKCSYWVAKALALLPFGLGMSQARAGYGIQLSIGNGASPEVYTHIAEVTSFSPPMNQGDSVEVTNHDSVGSFKEYIITLLDGGEISGEANWIYSDPGQTAVLAAMFARQVVAFKLTIPFATVETVTFNGIMKKWNPDTPLKQAMTAKFSIQVTGQPVYTP